jgi:hypothetical protein
MSPEDMSVSLGDPRRALGLHLPPAAILRYRDAGVTHIVIDPDTNALEQYLDDLERFAAEVRPLVIPQSERPPGSPMARQSDVLTTSMTRGSVE